MDPIDLMDWSAWQQRPTHPCIIDDVSIDSRTIRSQKTLFVALRGRRGDGHKYVERAITAGAIYALVETDYQAPESISESRLIRVPSPLESLQDLAQYYRESIQDLFLIAVAGSCGKTMLKDLMGHLFQGDHVYISPESFNSQFGVALSLLHMPRTTSLAFIEMAATKENEMMRLTKMALPQAALVTNFYRKRLGTQETKDGIAQQIVYLLTSLPKHGFAIVERDAKVDTSAVVCDLSFWNETTAKAPCVRILGPAGHEKLKLSSLFPDGTEAVFTINASHAYATETCTLAIQAAQKLGLSSTAIVQHIQRYHPETMRTEVWKNKSGTTFVNGTYCHTTLSFEASLDELAAFAQSTSSVQSGKTLLVFGGLKNGEHNPSSAKRLVDSMASHGITEVYSWPNGVTSSLLMHSSGRITIHGSDSIEEAISAAKKRISPFDTLIFKGPKKLPFDWLFEQIEESPPNSVACINLAAIRSNIELIRRKLPTHTRIMVMVKALAYGTDDIRISHFLNTCGVDILGVSFVDEGVSMRKLGVKQPIFVINAALYEMKKAARWSLEVGVGSDEQIDAAHDAAEELKTQLKVHLHVDTGMKRLGCPPKQALTLAKKIAASPHLVFEGIFTHFSVADDPSQDAFTLNQAATLTSTIQELEANHLHPTYRHACNSAAAIRFSFDQFNMVRIGLATFGFHTSPATLPLLELRPALSLTSHIIGFNQGVAGETISYGRTHTITSPNARIAVLPIGYFDGLHRSYSGKAHVIIRGKRAPMVGRICMDYLMVDVTHIPDAAVSDHALLFGEDEFGTYLPPEELAASGGSIVHELMTCLGPRIQRLFIYDESLLTR